MLHHLTRDRGRTLPAPPQSAQSEHPPYAAQPTPYSYPPAPQPIIFMPPWPTNQGNHAAPYGPVAAMPNMATTPAEPQYQTLPSSAGVDIPTVEKWFCYLDQHEARSRDGITFVPYGAILKEMGFNHLSHLTPEFFRLADLQQWLRVAPGTANAILHYAKEDLDALRSGKWVFPKHI